MPTTATPIAVTDDDTAILDTAILDNASVDDLYGHLGGADAAPEPEAVTLGALHANARTADPNLLQDLKSKGKALFDRYWPMVQAKVCGLYAEDGGAGDKKGWIARAASAIAAAFNLTAAVAVLVIGIAIKLGLDALCATEPAPA